jgi:alpha-amylase
MEHFDSAIKNQSALGRVYLPTASYPEMLKWALPVESTNEFEEFENILNSQNLSRFSTFVRGGYWRNFLAKYPEANWLHKKMLRVSNKIQKYQEGGRNVTTAVDYLLAGQCNDAYWHGVFGGLYLTNLRFPLYQNLINAECELDKVSSNYPSIEVTDFDCDGLPEVLYESSKLNLYLKPDKGGAIYEADYKSKHINILDVLSRSKEYSHKKLLQATNAQSTEAHLLESLIYDNYKHASLIDHFFSESTTVQDFIKNSYIELGDFVDNPYQFSVDTRKGITNIELKRRGKVLNQNISHEIEIIKIITLKNNDVDISVTYQLINLSGKPLNLRFGVEWNYGLLAGDATDRYYKVEGAKLDDPRLKSVGSLKDIRLLALVDEWLKLRIELEATSNAEFWRCPIETVSLSEAGLEKVYQSSIVIPIWNIDLKDTWGITVKQRLISF